MLFRSCVLVPAKEERIVFRVTLISAIVNVVLNFILIPLWGISAAAITTTVAEALTFLISFYYSRKYIALIKIRRNLFSVILGCMFILVTCYFTGRINLFLLRIVSSVFGSVVVYFAVLVLTRNPVLLQIKTMATIKHK